MKRLTLVRHAKSSWKNAALADSDRPLSGRGKQDAPRMGAFLASQGIVPDIILASPARRARKTAQLLAAAIPAAAGRILLDPALYEASAEALLERVRALDETWQHVMLVGHNPGLPDTFPSPGIVCPLCAATREEPHEHRQDRRQMPGQARQVIHPLLSSGSSIGKGGAVDIRLTPCQIRTSLPRSSPRPFDRLK
jgi:phosphohistidine phosphatase